VAGFRIDAAKHMDPTQITNILGLLTAPFYNTKVRLAWFPSFSCF
jgi:glycosidase